MLVSFDKKFLGKYYVIVLFVSNSEGVNILFMYLYYQGNENGVSRKFDKAHVAHVV